MAKTIVIAGHGPGISDAVARHFGKRGFSVALAARSADKLEAAANALRESGIEARAFPTDLSDPDAVQSLITKASEAFGPVTVVHWNAYAGLAGDLTTAPLAELRTVLDVGIVGLVAAVQAALPGMKQQADAAVLVTGGGFAIYGAQVDRMAAQYDAMGLAVSKAAQHKLVGVLSAKLAPEGIYVGEVQVLGMVKGTAFDRGAATIEPQTIAEKFWDLYAARKDTVAQVG